MTSKAKMEKSLAGIGFRRRMPKENNCFSLDISTFCTVFVFLYSDTANRKAWRMNVLYIPTDSHHAKDHFCDIKHPKDVMVEIVKWAMDRGSEEMRKEALQEVSYLHIRLRK